MATTFVNKTVGKAAHCGFECLLMLFNIYENFKIMVKSQVLEIELFLQKILL